jgi:hypothetical protein
MHPSQENCGLASLQQGFKVWIVHKIRADAKVYAVHLRIRPAETCNQGRGERVC